MSFEAIEILTTGKCPLNCEYCYIPKTKEMDEIHEDIAKKIKSGEFLKDFKKISNRKNLKFLSFWGTEPGLTLPLLEEKLDEIVDLLPNLEGIGFSTSTISAVDSIISFAEALDKRAEELTLEVQISLDGHELIVDQNRFKGAAKKIPENFFTLIDSLQDISNIKVEFKWKPTISIENIAVMNERPDEIDNYFNYFKNLNRKFDKLNNNKRVTLRKGSIGPTLAVPGDYSSEDGKEFGLFLKKLHKRGRSTYTGRLKKIFDYGDEIWKKKRMFTCSGGDSQIGLEDKVHMCHRSFYMNDDRYLKGVKKSNKDNWDETLMDRGFTQLIKDWYTVSVDDDYEKKRFEYVMRGYHDFWKLSLAYTYSMTKELALVDQVEEEFLKNEEYLNLFCLFINTALSCPMENLLNTGSIHLTPISLIRMFGNGAFREILNDLEKNVS